MDLGEAFGWVGDPDGEREVHEAEAVAQFAWERLVERAQVVGNCRADLIDEAVAAEQLAAQGAGHGRGQDVVDRRASRVADRLEVVKRDPF